MSSATNITENLDWPVKAAQQVMFEWCFRANMIICIYL